MTRQEIAKALKTLDIAFPTAYKGITVEEMRDTIDVWETHFKEIQNDVMEKAIHCYIDECEYPPTIAGIRKYIDNLN